MVAGHPPPLLVDGETVDEVIEPGPILGAFEDAEWEIRRAQIEPGQQLVIVTDGIAESRGATERFGEERLRAELSGAANSALALQRLEGRCTRSPSDRLKTTSRRWRSRRIRKPAPRARGEMDVVEHSMVERLYDCFNSRDEAGIVELCDDSMEFFPVATAEAVGREAPYRGRTGLRDYLADVAQVWEELRIAADEVEARGERVLARGRVYARSRELGIRNLPTAWIWEIRGGHFTRGAVFPDPDQAVAAFASGVSTQGSA